MIVLKSPREIELLREAGRIARLALDAARAMARPGVTTGEIDAEVERVIRANGATPEFKGYHGFPASSCISVNDQVVHGIPGDAQAEGRRHRRGSTSAPASGASWATTPPPWPSVASRPRRSA